MKKLLMAIALALVVGMGAAPAEARHFSSPPRIQVMSQNLYIGADLSRLLSGESPAAVLATVQETSFSERAMKIAKAIDDFNPDVIGLQEVSDITVFNASGQTVLKLDYLDILMKALAARGESYAVGSTVSNADVTLPIDGPPATATTFGRVVDRDVILYRTRTASVSGPSSANFTTNFTASVGGFPIEFTRGYTGVDATVRGKTVRFVNTHLEVEDAPCATPTGLVICQDVQAVELQKALASEALPTILVGDFNAVPGSTAYNTIDNGGWTDAWKVRVPYPAENGFTCCQSETLLNKTSELNQRIDLLWLSDGDFRNTSIRSTVVGDWDARKTPSGRWYSDHGGPFARIVW
ncbi:MAG: endonuclease/exonuclease/phosphatase family protein [Gemmatimonadota bacterium]|nr:endonuclease/exonuclease/phosphatase family protein [Gemmatimonadota bacterium]